MEELIRGLKKVRLVPANMPKSELYDFFGRNLQEENTSLIRKKLYDGRVLCCLDYKAEHDEMTVSCQPVNFFDFANNRFRQGLSPKILNVNAMIRVQSDYLVMIKRGTRVYDYPRCWDLPAGFLVAGISPLERLADRILNDTGLDKTSLQISSEPSFVLVKSNSFGLYYSATAKFSKKRLEEFFKRNFRKNRPILLHRSEIQDFLKTHKVYPMFLRELF